LIQTVGRAARNVEGRAIFYADRMTGSMQRAIDETARRRTMQRAYNAEHGITPRSVIKSAEQVRFITRVADARTDHEAARAARRSPAEIAAAGDRDAAIARLEQEMQEAAAALDFETAARLRDALFEIRATLGGRASSGASADGGHGSARRRVSSGAPRS
jgi:excinuclease ABC subunit B